MLTAGRELDALVAEKVMGFKVVDDPLVDFNGARYIHKIEVAFERGPHSGHRWPERVGPLPAYSADIAAAWQVVERFWLVQIVRSEVYHEAYEVRIMTETGPEHVEEANTAPLAICRAALKAVGAVD